MCWLLADYNAADITSIADRNTSDAVAEIVNCETA